MTNLGCICDDLGCVGDDLGCICDEFGLCWRRIWVVLVTNLGNLSDDLGSFDNALWIVPGVTARFDSS